MKKKILYIIDSLERGGAEIMLVSPLAEIQEHYDIIIVTLKAGKCFHRAGIGWRKEILPANE